MKSFKIRGKFFHLFIFYIISFIFLFDIVFCEEETLCNDDEKENKNNFTKIVIYTIIGLVLGYGLYILFDTFWGGTDILMSSQTESDAKIAEVATNVTPATATEVATNVRPAAVTARVPGTAGMVGVVPSTSAKSGMGMVNLTIPEGVRHIANSVPRMAVDTAIAKQLSPILDGFVGEWPKIFTNITYYTNIRENTIFIFQKLSESCLTTNFYIKQNWTSVSVAPDIIRNSLKTIDPSYYEGILFHNSIGLYPGNELLYIKEESFPILIKFFEVCPRPFLSFLFKSVLFRNISLVRFCVAVGGIAKICATNNLSEDQQNFIIEFFVQAYVIKRKLNIAYMLELLPL